MKALESHTCGRKGGGGEGPVCSRTRGREVNEATGQSISQSRRLPHVKLFLEDSREGGEERDEAIQTYTKCNRTDYGSAEWFVRRT